MSTKQDYQAALDSVIWELKVNNRCEKNIDLKVKLDKLQELIDNYKEDTK